MRQLLIVAAMCARAWACSCGSYPSAKDAWLDSPLVFVGFVEKTNPRILTGHGMSGEQIAWVRVTEPFKGVQADQVLELRDQFSSCFGGFHEGTTLLFYLHAGRKQGTWGVPACYRPGPIVDAADDLRFLRGLPASARGNRVSGKVTLWEDNPAEGELYRRHEMAGSVCAPSATRARTRPLPAQTESTNSVICRQVDTRSVSNTPREQPCASQSGMERRISGAQQPD
jgi:hypothetical protein